MELITTLLLWALIIARLFQVQVASEYYPPSPGNHMFQLGQRVVMWKVDTSIDFDGGGNCMLATEDYTRKIKLKNVGSGFLV